MRHEARKGYGWGVALVVVVAACGSSTGDAAAPPGPPPASATASGSAPAASSAVPQASAAAPPTPAQVEELAFAKAKPVFDAQCAPCHSSKGKSSSKVAMSHLSMDAYPFGGHHAAEIAATIRKVLGTAGAKPTMPRGNPGAVKGPELAAILAWADAFDVTHPPKAAPHHHEH